MNPMEKTGSKTAGFVAQALKAPWSVPVAVDAIPEQGRHVEIEAPAEVRAQVVQLVAGLASVRELAHLSASFDVTRQGSGVHVAGRVRARVGQICVVTLDPIEREVDEAVDIQFVLSKADESTAPKEIAIDADRELPEPLTGSTLDLGALATEFLVLGVDPYPRKEGAEFGTVKIGDDGPKHFAGLEALKKRLGGGNS